MLIGTDSVCIAVQWITGSTCSAKVVLQVSTVSAACVRAAPSHAKTAGSLALEGCMRVC
jgi:hypothetical protein